MRTGPLGGTTFLNLAANSTGTSLLDVNFWSGDGTENLTVDLSAYTDGFDDGGTALGSLDLIENQFATFDASRWDSVSLVGAYGDFVYTDYHLWNDAQYRERLPPSPSPAPQPFLVLADWPSRYVAGDKDQIIKVYLCSLWRRRLRRFFSSKFPTHAP